MLYLHLPLHFIIFAVGEVQKCFPFFRALFCSFGRIGSKPVLIHIELLCEVGHFMEQTG